MIADMKETNDMRLAFGRLYRFAIAKAWDMVWCNAGDEARRLDTEVKS